MHWTSFENFLPSPWQASLFGMTQRKKQIIIKSLHFMAAFQKCNLHTIFYVYFTHMKTEITNLFGWQRLERNICLKLLERDIFWLEIIQYLSQTLLQLENTYWKPAIKVTFTMPSQVNWRFLIISDYSATSNIYNSSESNNFVHVWYSLASVITPITEYNFLYIIFESLFKSLNWLFLWTL